MTMRAVERSASDRLLRKTAISPSVDMSDVER
jgi:hypothetical protein